MSEKIFLTSLFVFCVLVIACKMGLGHPVNKHPKTAEFCGGMFVIAVTTIIVSGIWSVWS